MAHSTECYLIVVSSYGAFAVLALLINLRARLERKQQMEAQKEFYESLSDAHTHDSSDEYEKGSVLLEEATYSSTFAKGVFTYSRMGNHMIKYNEHNSISFDVLFMFKHTLLSEPEISSKMLIALALGGAFFALDWWIESKLMEPAGLTFSLSNLDTLCNFITSLVGVLLGFYISTVYGRWWSLRNDTLGSLWGAVDDMCCLMGAHFSGLEYRKTRELVLRYCMAAYELTFMQAVGDDHELWRLVNRHLLTQDEADKLQSLPSRSQVIWTWVAWIFNGLHQQGVCDNITLQLFYSKCIQARGAIGGIFAYLNTQVPFIYVQLLASMVHGLTVAIALNCGVSSARWASTCTNPDQEPVHGTIVKMVQLFVIPYFYNGCLEVARIMADPLGNDFSDFPRHAFHFYMRQEADAFHSTMEVPCAAAVDALRDVARARRSGVRS